MRTMITKFAMRRTSGDVLTEFHKLAQNFTVGDFTARVSIHIRKKGEPEMIIFLTENDYYDRIMKIKEDYWEFGLDTGEMLSYKEDQQKRIKDQESVIMMALADGRENYKKYTSLFKEYKKLLRKEIDKRQK